MTDSNYVTIVLPTYQRPGLLARCLTSLVQQNFPASRFEIIVVSDSFDPLTKNVVKDFQKNYKNNSLKFYHTNKKSGPAAARNTGWQAASGELILFTDDDCIAGANWINAFWNTYKTMQLKEIAFTGKTVVPLPKPPTDFDKNLAGLERSEFITANCACSKNALEKINGFDEAFTMAWREDSDLHFKLLDADIPIVRVEEALITHPTKKVQWAISLKEQKKSMYNVLLYKKHPDYYKQKITPFRIWSYYISILSFTGFIIAMIFQFGTISRLCFLVWALFTVIFFIKRIKGTSKQAKHVAEMIFTSALIPFLSVYWTLYGSYRFKKLLL